MTAPAVAWCLLARLVFASGALPKTQFIPGLEGSFFNGRTIWLYWETGCEDARANTVVNTTMGLWEALNPDWHLQCECSEHVRALTRLRPRPLSIYLRSPSDGRRAGKRRC